MKEIAPLLEKLAEKLGTTSEYLWGILLKQAPIEATIIVGQMLLIVLFGIVLIVLHKRFSSTVDGESLYSRYEEAIAIPMIVCMVVFVILALSAFYAIPELMYGYFNPEYWALQEILKQF